MNKLVRILIISSVLGVGLSSLIAQTPPPGGSVAPVACGDCEACADSCTPASPPPTAWNHSCCNDNIYPADACREVWWRDQTCVRPNGTTFPGYAWKQETYRASPCHIGGCG